MGLEVLQQGRPAHSQRTALEPRSPCCHAPPQPHLAGSASSRPRVSGLCNCCEPGPRPAAGAAGAASFAAAASPPSRATGSMPVTLVSLWLPLSERQCAAIFSMVRPPWSRSRGSGFCRTIRSASLQLVAMAQDGTDGCGKGKHLLYCFTATMQARMTGVPHSLTPALHVCLMDKTNRQHLWLGAPPPTILLHVLLEAPSRPQPTPPHTPVLSIQR